LDISCPRICLGVIGAVLIGTHSSRRVGGATGIAVIHDLVDPDSVAVLVSAE